MSASPCLSSPVLSALILAGAIAVEPARGLGSSPSVSPSGSSTPLDLAATRDWIDEFFAAEMAEHGVPGAAFALVHGGELQLLLGYGRSDLDGEVAVDPQRTVFRVGSVSKTLTALAALELVARGRLDLQADLGGPIAELGAADPLEEALTLHHLLTHTAGFSERLFGQHARSPQELTTLRGYLERRLPPRRRSPGRVIGYNDHHSTLVGVMIEDATGEPFAAAARTLVLAPLGLGSSAFEQVDLPLDLEPRLAKAYRRLDQRLLPLARDYVHTVPAAGLFTTAEDMGRLLVALLDGGRLDSRQAVSEQAVTAMLATQFRHGEGMRGRGYGLAEGREQGRRTLYKDGQCSGFTARLFLVPEEGVGWFSVVNLSIFGRAGSFLGVSALHRRLSAGLMEQLFADSRREAPAPSAEVSSPPRAMEGASERAHRYVGTYRDTMDPRSGWEGNLIANELRVRATTDGAVEVFGAKWVETAAGTFELAGGGGAPLRFESERHGQPRWLTFHAGAWERLAWYESARFRLAAAVALGLWLSTPAATMLLTRRRNRRRRPVPAAARWLCASSTTLVLFPLAVLTALLFTDIQVLYSGLTAPLRMIFLLPWLAIVFLVVALFSALRRREGARLPFYWLSVGPSCALALFLLRQGNLLGWPP